MPLIEDADKLIKVITLISVAYALYCQYTGTEELHGGDEWLAEKSATAKTPTGGIR